MSAEKKNILTDDQIEFILNDIRSRGVVLESLQQSLLDHICCILENEVEVKNDFESAYRQVMKDYFNENLLAIEKETRLLLKNKHYYLMKKILYILLFVSIGVNLAVIGNIAYNYFSDQRKFAQWNIEKDITLPQATIALLKKIKTEYPQSRVRDLIFISFKSEGFLLHEEEELMQEMSDLNNITVDSLKKQKDFQRDVSYRRLDSLAEQYPNVTFVVAYRLNNKKTHKLTDEYRAKTKHLLILDGMYELYSGCQNTMHPEKHHTGVVFYNSEFIIDRKGELIYSPKTIFQENFDKQLLQTLAGTTP